MSEAQPKSDSRLNTILLWVTLAALGTIGATSFSNANALAELKGGQLTRVELDTRLAEIKNAQAQQALEIVNIRLELAKLVRPAAAGN